MTVECTLKFKKNLKALIGQDRSIGRFNETSFFGAEMPPAGQAGSFSVVGPSASRARNWFARVTVDANGTITKVE